MTGLENSKLFGSLSGGELEALRRSCVERSFRPTEVIFKEGDKGDGIYFVREGVVQISALIGQGQDRKVFTRVREGEFFGEMAVLDDEPRSATATAETATHVYFIQREHLLHMLESSPRLAVSLVREFSLRMREFNRQYIQEAIQAERLTLVGRFARSIVHDFKNPLNIIGLAAELVDMESASPQLRKTGTERIRKQVDRLSNMISELLEFTRGPQHAVVLASHDFAAYVQEVIADLRAEVQDKQVTIQMRSAPPSVELPLDQKRLMHVFSNLVHNAVDAMPDGGTIFFDFERTPETVITTIQDTGKGIPEEILPRLFEAFATFGKAKGTGLGLSICKKIVEDHRGWIHARNEPGRGATFAFALPFNAS